MEGWKTCSVRELRERLNGSGGGVRLVDVREYPEFADGHIEGARLAPLSDLGRNPKLAGEADEVILVCRTGRRAREAAAILRQANGGEPVIVEGGLEAWKQAGYPLRREQGPISLERQVRIAAGSLVLAGLLIPGLGFLPYVVGAGLIFAGVTNTCAMGLLLARLPWNRPKRETTACPR
ncbi:MAG: rhodanese-like domain-containing protein [Armatimonadetes bacterium]|nr:rhodanese-like domain-containing protein [Armatimonadota bacterium]